MKSNKGTRYKKINCRPDYILERIDFWCRFWKLRCFVIGTWPKCLYWRGEFNAPEGHSQLTKWYETFHLNGTWSIYVSLWDLRLLKLNVFWLKHLLEDWCVSRRTSYLLICQVRKVKLHLNAPWILRSQKFISYVAQSFESIFWKLRDCFLTWNVFLCLKSCIGCDFRPLKFDNILLA